MSVLCVSLLHCEKSGESVGDSASARSGRAQTAKILRARSVSAVDVTRGFSPCLIFCYFWIKPKVHIMLFLSKKEPKKTATDARSAGRDRKRAMPHQKEETERSEGKAKKSGNRRCSRLKRYADKLAPALLDGASAAGSVSRFFAMRNCGALRAEQSIPTFRFTLLGMTTLSTDRRSALSHCEKSGRSGGDSASARSGYAKQRSLLCPLSERG